MLFYCLAGFIAYVYNLCAYGVSSFVWYGEMTEFYLFQNIVNSYLAFSLKKHIFNLAI